MLPTKHFQHVFLQVEKVNNRQTNINSTITIRNQILSYLIKVHRLCSSWLESCSTSLVGMFTWLNENLFGKKKKEKATNISFTEQIHCALFSTTRKKRIRSCILLYSLFKKRDIDSKCVGWSWDYYFFH